ncbi:MAG: hypothetical protein K2K80_06305 [Clostridia bacterium]|nr:hypothetical protein [Clostridia bacterium]
MIKLKRSFIALFASVIAAVAIVAGVCILNPRTAAADTAQPNGWAVMPEIASWTYDEYNPKFIKPVGAPVHGDAADVVYTFYEADSNGNIIADTEKTSLDGFKDKLGFIPAGKYAMKATVEAKDGYDKLEAKVNFEVGPAVNGWKVEPNVAPWTESEEPNAPVGEPKFGVAKFEIYSENGKVLYYSNVKGKPDNRTQMKAGWYTLKASADGTSDYSGIGSHDYKFRVFPATVNNWTVVPNIQGWEEGDEPNTPVGQAQAPGSLVEFKYKVKGADDSTATYDVPEEKGEYVLIAIAKADGYEDLRAEVGFKIGLRTLPPNTNEWTTIPSIAGWEEGDEPNVPVAKAKAGNSISYVYKSLDGTLLNAAPAEAGEYIVEVTAHAPGYNDLKAELKFSVTEKVTVLAVNSWSVAPNIQGWTVGNKTSEPVGSAKAGTVFFDYTTSDGTVLDSKPSKAGSYKLVATAIADGYETLVAEIAFTISPESDSDITTWIVGISVLGVLAVVFAVGCFLFLTELWKYGLGIKTIFRKPKPAPAAAQPVVVQPVEAQPVEAQFIAEQPFVEQPAMGQPVEEPIAVQPVAEPPVIEQPVAVQPIETQPVTEQPVEAPIAPTEAPVAEQQAVETEEKSSENK